MNPNRTMKKIIHIPYHIDPSTNRFHYYETLWKNVALGLLQRHEPQLQGWTLLDYGSGRGETLKIAKEMGMTVKGTDLDPKCVDMSSAFGPAELLNIADPVGQLGRKAYDVVTCFHVLEHVPSPVTTLGHISELARRYVLLAVPNGGLIPDVLRPRRNCREINEGHLQTWDHSHLLNLAQRHCGLCLVEWAFDHVKIPIISSQIAKILGQKVAVYLETGLFRSLFPYQSTSIIGLFKVAEADPDQEAPAS